MTAISPTAEGEAEAPTEQPAPACVMSFNVSDPSGAGGSAGDVATIAAMGAHALPVITSIVMRDTAEIFDHHPIEADLIVEQARSVLEDVTIAAWKVGFLGSTEGVSAVAEILADYPDVPLVTYLPNLAWVEEDEQQSYLEAFRELVLPQTEVLVGSHQTLTDFLLPDWNGERPPSSREIAIAANKHGTRYVLVTSVPLPDQFLDNVLANAQGAITGEKFERFETTFVGAGETLSAGAGGAAGHRASSCMPRSARRWPSSTRRSTRAFARGWATSFPTASSGPCPKKARRKAPTRPRPSPARPTRPLRRATRAMSTSGTGAPGRTNAALFERARRVIPGGVNSPVRAFRAVGGTPRFIARAEGAVPVSTPKASATSTTSAPGGR